MPMKYPPHPSGVIKDCIEDLGLSVTDAARVLDVPRSTLSRLLNRHSAISPEMALRLSAAFGSSPEMWLRMQAAFDLAQARDRADLLNVRRYEPARSPTKQPALT